jgi:APA family basic amino acid/polyamine antiporter
VPLFPLLPLLFCGSCAYMLWSSLSYVSRQTLGGLNAAWIGIAVLAVGLVLLAFLHQDEALHADPNVNVNANQDKE